MKIKAPDFLRKGAQHMEDRAATYDQEQGERSIERTVNMFNELTGQNMSAEEGWLFMALLKIVRSQQGPFKADNYEDMAAYAALAGEQAFRDRAANPVPKLTDDDIADLSRRFMNGSISKEQLDKELEGG